jgi:hypothetical protein
MWKIDGVKIIICVTFLILSGCDSRQSDTVKKINTIEIVDIQPPVSKPITPGQKVTTEVKLVYELKSKAATVALAVLRSEGLGNKALASTFTIIQQGKGELMLQVEFIAPKKIQILHVHVPLIPQQRNDSAPFAKRTYTMSR